MIRTLALALIVGLLSAPAMAESTVVTLTGSWQKIASPYSSVDIQSVSGSAILTTVDWNAAAGQAEPPAPGTSTVGQAMLVGEHRCVSLSVGELYAKTPASGSLIVMDGVTCGSRTY